MCAVEGIYEQWRQIVCSKLRQDENSLNPIRLLMEKLWRSDYMKRVTGGSFNHGLSEGFEGINVGLHGK